MCMYPHRLPAAASPDAGGGVHGYRIRTPCRRLHTRNLRHDPLPKQPDRLDVGGIRHIERHVL